MPQSTKDILARIFILLGFSILLFWLVITNQLILYVHPRFTNLIKVSSCIFFMMLLMQCWNLKKSRTSSTCSCSSHRSYLKYLPFILTLLIAFVLPNSALNASLITNKGLNSQLTNTTSNSKYRPLADELKQTSFIKIYDHNYIGVLKEFYYYPEEYVGKQIEMKGFVYKNDTSNRLSIVRYVVGCCVADASPYGITCEIADPDTFIDGNWYEIQGTIEACQINEKKIPILKITWLKPVNQPALPYIFP